MCNEPKPNSIKSSKSIYTKSISRNAARNMHHASRFAGQIGGNGHRKYPEANVTIDKPLNLFVTINWGLLGASTDHFRTLRNERYCRWLRTRSKQLKKEFKPTYIAVIEKGDVHWNLHMPEELYDDFCDLLPKRVASMLNKTNGRQKRSANMEPVPDHIVNIQDTRNSVAVRKYMLKGINPPDAFRFGIHKLEDHVVILGRRTAVSRTLGTVARLRAGYKPMMAAHLFGDGKQIPRGSEDFRSIAEKYSRLPEERRNNLDLREHSRSCLVEQRIW